MIVENRISSKEIVSKVFNDIDYQEQPDYTTWVSWIYDIMEKIRQPMIYETKYIDASIDPTYNFIDYQVLLPCDFYKLEWVLVNGVPSRLATGVNQALISNPCITADVPTQWNTLTQMPYFIDGFNHVYTASATPYSGYLSEFKIESGVVRFNIPSGNCVIIYKAFPVDEEGYPMIPDDGYVKDAIAKFIIRNLDYIAWRRGDITDKVFEYSDREYLFAIAQCISGLKQPSVEQMELVKKQHLRLVQRPVQYVTGFGNYGRKF